MSKSWLYNVLRWDEVNNSQHTAFITFFYLVVEASFKTQPEMVSKSFLSFEFKEKSIHLFFQVYNIQSISYNYHKN